MRDELELFAGLLDGVVVTRFGEVTVRFIVFGPFVETEEFVASFDVVVEAGRIVIVLSGREFDVVLLILFVFIDVEDAVCELFNRLIFSLDVFIVDSFMALEVVGFESNELRGLV